MSCINNNNNNKINNDNNNNNNNNNNKYLYRVTTSVMHLLSVWAL